MRSLSGPVPNYFGVTLVVTAFSPDEQGQLAHCTTVDTTSIEVIEVHYVPVLARGDRR